MNCDTHRLPPRLWDMGKIVEKKMPPQKVAFARYSEVVYGRSIAHILSDEELPTSWS